MSANNPKRLATIAARCEAATPGPWSVGGYFAPTYSVYGNHDELLADTNGDGTKADAEFVAASRTDVPWLLEQLQTARALLAKVKDSACYMNCAYEGRHPGCSCAAIDRFLEGTTDAE